MIQTLSENDPKLIPTMMRARMRSRARSAACETPVRYRGIAKVLGRDPEVQQQFFQTALGNPCGPSVVSWRALEVRRKLLGVSLGGPWNSFGRLCGVLGVIGAVPRGPWGLLGESLDLLGKSLGLLVESLGFACGVPGAYLGAAGACLDTLPLIFR